MPELPDLEVFKGNLREELLGYPLRKIVVNNIRQTNFADKDLSFGHVTLKDIERNGKELFFMFTDNLTFSVHLMLSGTFNIINKSDGSAALPYSICTFCFDSKSLIISDSQTLCRVTENPLLPDVPDALSELFTYDYLKSNLKNKKLMNIKSFLIDQKIVRGIGNAYADEILYDAKISPLSYCGKIPEERMKILYKSIADVLKNAIARIKEINPKIIGGEERNFLKVHNKNKSITDSGERIIIKTVASKKTYYTEEQIYYF